MVQSSKPWNDNSPGDAGPYSAQLWAYMYRAFFANVFTANDDRGVLPLSGNGTNSPLLVAVTSPATNQVRVYPGEAFVNGRHYISDAQENLTIAANGSPNPRIDRIVLRQDFSAQTIRLVVLQGVAGVIPVAPSLTQDREGTFEIPLAQVAVPSGFSVISTGITDERVSAVVFPTQHGGTSLSSFDSAFTEGQILVASAADNMVLVPPMTDYSIFGGDSSQPGNINVVSQRPHQLRGPQTSTWALTRPANTTSGTLIPFTTAKYLNPDGYITSLAANLFTLEAGSYIVTGAINIGNEAAGTNFNCDAWIADNSAPTVRLVQTPQCIAATFGSVAGAGGGTLVFPESLLDSDGVQQFGVRFRSFSAGGASNLSLDGNEEFQYIISFRKIK